MIITVDEISTKVAEELNLHPNLVKQINRIQWKFTHKEIQSGDFNPIQIFYIGKFSRKLDRKSTWVINKIQSKKRENEQSSKGNI
jgi:putative sterol carrier protein